MAKTKAQKNELVDEYKQKLQQSQTIYVVQPKALTPNEATQLKKELSALDSTFNVVKNSLFKVALKEAGLPELAVFDAGEHAVLFSGAQVSQVAKVLARFARETEKLEISDGLLNGEKISAAQVKDLAELPAKDVLITQVLYIMNAPVRNLLSVMSGNMRDFLNVLHNLKEQKQQKAKA
ncbi:MAG TPA: 50S ribosomal protein L10 [Candidatus Dojkabacteria bacterium]|nr:50S ribosomal protein L10 [Candidatus Dojkabacteria bacterium]